MTILKEWRSLDESPVGSIPLRDSFPGGIRSLEGSGSRQPLEHGPRHHSSERSVADGWQIREPRSMVSLSGWTDEGPNSAGRKP